MVEISCFEQLRQICNFKSFKPRPVPAERQEGVLK